MRTADTLWQPGHDKAGPRDIRGTRLTLGSRAAHDEYMDLARITVDHQIMGGVPCVAGTRIPVTTVVGLIADGLTADEILTEVVVGRPPGLAALRRAAGHDCAHVYELGFGGQPDEQVMALADRDNRILVSADTDFGELLANAPVLAPSVILLRRADKRARSLAAVILANLEQVADDLAAGALIVISDTRIRDRRLPMKQSD
jgi:predicted nuclease of predicted toxin-antitoxin system